MQQELVPSTSGDSPEPFEIRMSNHQINEARQFSIKVFEDSSNLPGLYAGVTRVLEVQFSQGVDYEVSGWLKRSGGSLIFEIMELPPEFKKLSEDLKKFETEFDSGAARAMAALLKEYIQSVREQLPAEDLTVLYGVLNDLNKISRRDDDGMDLKRKQYLAKIARLTFESYSPLSLTPSPTDQSDWIGIFHVHQDGSPPSQADLAVSAEFPLPLIVILAKPDYVQTGFQVRFFLDGDEMARIQPRK